MEQSRRSAEGLYPSIFGSTTSSSSSPSSQNMEDKFAISSHCCPCVGFTDTLLSCRHKNPYGQICAICNSKVLTELYILSRERTLHGKMIGCMTHEDVNVKRTGCHHRQTCPLPQVFLAIQHLYSGCPALSVPNSQPCHSCEKCSSAAQMQTTLTDILTMYSRYKEIIRRANGVHDPITSKLSNELITMIFEYACYDSWDGPLTLGAVCQQWRTIVYGTSSFWPTICFNVELAFDMRYYADRPMSKKNRNKLDVFRGWLERSGQRPISLYLTLRKRYTGPANDVQRELRQDEVEREFMPFLELVNNHSSRLKLIDVEALQAVLLTLGPAFEGPLLRRLEITASDGGHYYAPNYDDDQEDDEEEFSVIPEQGVDERDMQLFVMNHGFNNIDCKRLNVTHISARYFHTESLLRALDTAPDILECRMADYNHIPLTTAVPVVHLRLTSLTIKDGFSQGLAILGDLTLPALKALTVHLPLKSDVDVDDNCILISEFIDRSTCRLTALELSFADLQEDKLDSILAYVLWTPFLHDLEEFSLLKLNFNPKLFFDILGRSSLNGLDSTQAKDARNLAYDFKNPRVTQPEDMVFLPNLKKFTYSMRTSDLRDTIPWNKLVESFGPFSNARRRPFTSVKIVPEWKLGKTDTIKPLLDSATLVPDAAKNLITAMRSGYHIMVPEEINEEDLTEKLL